MDKTELVLISKSILVFSLEPPATGLAIQIPIAKCSGFALNKK
jgi:hypothetical protein